MNDIKDFKLLRDYAKRYFKSKNYSADILDKHISKEIFEKSLILVEYDSKNEVITLINNENQKEYIDIDLINEMIDGKISIYWDSKRGKCDPFLPLGYQVHNKEIIRKCFDLTDLSMRAIYVPAEKSFDKIGGYALILEENQDGFYNVSDMKIYSMFDNPSEFVTDLNIKKNIYINNINKFVWNMRALDSLKEIASDEIPIYNILVEKVNITDAVINKIFDSNPRKILSVNNIKFKDCVIDISAENKDIFSYTTKFFYENTHGRFD